MGVVEEAGQGRLPDEVFHRRRAENHPAVFGGICADEARRRHRGRKREDAQACEGKPADNRKEGPAAEPAESLFHPGGTADRDGEHHRPLCGPDAARRETDAEGHGRLLRPDVRGRRDDRGGGRLLSGRTQHHQRQKNLRQRQHQGGVRRRVERLQTARVCGGAVSGERQDRTGRGCGEHGAVRPDARSVRRGHLRHEGRAGARRAAGGGRQRPEDVAGRVHTNAGGAGIRQRGRSAGQHRAANGLGAADVRGEGKAGSHAARPHGRENRAGARAAGREHGKPEGARNDAQSEGTRPQARDGGAAETEPRAARASAEDTEAAPMAEQKPIPRAGRAAKNVGRDFGRHRHLRRERGGRDALERKASGDVARPGRYVQKGEGD